MTGAAALPSIAPGGAVPRGRRYAAQCKLPVSLYYPAVFGAAMLTHHVVEVPGRRFLMQYTTGVRTEQHARTA